MLGGIRAARDAGLTPLKINCVLLRGFNDDQVEGFARFARQEDVVVRFIEFMPLEEGRLWTPEIVVSLHEIVERIGRVMPLVELAASRTQRDGAALRFCRWARRDRYYCPGDASLLRRVQPGTPHLRWKNPHLPLLAD